MRGSTRNLIVAVAAGTLVGGVNLAPPVLESWAPAPADDSLDELAADLDEIVDDPSMDGGQAAVVVQDAASGETVYQHDPGQRLMPASNEKLLTSAVAMDVLGPEHTF